MKSADGSNAQRADKQLLAGRLELAWVLLDFGRRDAAFRSAELLLAAAHWHQDGVLADAFLDATKTYFSAWTSKQRLVLAQQVLDLTAENLIAADERYKAGVGAFSDRLQAQTAYIQAELRFSRESSLLADLLGQIALRMAIPANSRLVLDGATPSFAPLPLLESIDDAIHDAATRHPSARVAQARVGAAVAVVDEIRAMGRPSLHLLGHLGKTDTQNQVASAQRHETQLGIELRIPLFSGFEQSYQVRSAQDRVKAAEAELAAIRLRVSLDIWSKYSSLRHLSTELGYVQELVSQSAQAMEASRERYKAGVGSIVEVLDTMLVYADSRQQHINAVGRQQELRVALAMYLSKAELSATDDISPVFPHVQSD